MKTTKHIQFLLIATLAFFPFQVFAEAQATTPEEVMKKVRDLAEEQQAAKANVSEENQQETDDPEAQRPNIPPAPETEKRDPAELLKAARRASRKARMSKLSEVGRKTTEKKATEKAKKSKKSSVSKRGEKVNLDYVNAEIGEIAKSIAELTGKNFIIDDKVRGKITIISPNPVSVHEAYQAFVSALEVKNYTVVQAGKMLKIIPLREMKKSPVPTDVRWAAGGDDAFVTRLIQMKFISASEIMKSLKNLISKNGDMISYEPTNTLIITESVGNIRRIMKIVNRLDQEGFQSNLEVIRLKYAPASDTAEKLKRIFDLKDSGISTPAGRKTSKTVRKATAPTSVESGGDSQFISKIMPDERTNSIIVLANQEGLKRIQEVIEKIDSSIEDAANQGRIHVHYLQYADAVELAGTLTGIASQVGSRSSSSSSRRGTDMFPRAGSSNASRNRPAPPTNSQGTTSGSLLGGEINITADAPTNSLVITASSSDYKSLLPVINRLDVRRSQAFIEAMIVEVDIDKAFDVGVANHAGAQFGSNDNTTLFGATGFGSDSSLFLPTDVSALGGFTFGLQGRTVDIPVAGGETLTIPLYGSLFRALQTNGTINLLSTPNILTADNTEAEIIVGNVVPFVTASGRDINNQPINQIQRENVAITLRVTPKINDSNDISMDIFQEIQDIVPGANIETYGPTTSTRSAKTSVIVRDGQTITLGGLISDRETDSVSKVPILGDIPILGWLFKSKNKTRGKTSLVIFMTPTIIREPEDLEAITIRKNEERKAFLEQNKMKDHPGISKYNMDKSLRTPPKKDLHEKPIPADSPTGSFLLTPPSRAIPEESIEIHEAEIPVEETQEMVAEDVEETTEGNTGEMTGEEVQAEEQDPSEIPPTLSEDSNDEGEEL